MPGQQNFTYDNKTNYVNNLNSNNSYNQTPFEYATEEVAHGVNLYFTPLLILFGTFGNLISVFVFFTSKLRLQSTSQYLSALAVSDTAFLIQLAFPWAYDVGLTGIFHESVYCQIFVYISYVTCCLSSWLVVAFTVERFVAIRYPLKRNAICSVKRARYIIAALTIAALVLNVPVVLFTSSTKIGCNIDLNYITFARTFNMVDTVIAFYVPLLLILLCNYWIMKSVWRLARARAQLLRAEAAAQRARRPRPVPWPPLSQQRVTQMLLLVSTVFIVLNLPAYTMRLISYMGGGGDTGHWAAMQKLALTCFDTNFGTNFFIYCVMAQNFRRALRQSVPWLREHAVRRTGSFMDRPRSSSLSTTSICTEVTTNNNAASAGTEQPRRARRRLFSCLCFRRKDPVIQRWTFDNSRYRRRGPAVSNNEYEMRVYRTSDYQMRVYPRVEYQMQVYPSTSRM